MINKPILKSLYCLILSALSLSVFAGDAVVKTVPMTVLLSNSITQQNGDPVDLSHVEIRIGSGDGWTRLGDIQGNANSSQTLLGESGTTTGLLRVTLPNGQRYVATFPIDSNFLQLTVEPSLSVPIPAASTGNKMAPQYELRTPTAVTRLTPVSAKGNSWVAECFAYAIGGGGLGCSSSGYSFEDAITGFFMGGLGTVGTLSSDADTFDQLFHEPEFSFEAIGVVFYMEVILHDQYNSYIKLGGVSTGSCHSLHDNLHWE